MYLCSHHRACWWHKMYAVTVVTKIGSCIYRRHQHLTVWWIHNPHKNQDQDACPLRETSSYLSIKRITRPISWRTVSVGIYKSQHWNVFNIYFHFYNLSHICIVSLLWIAIIYVRSRWYVSWYIGVIRMRFGVNCYMIKRKTNDVHPSIMHMVCALLLLVVW